MRIKLIPSESNGESFEITDLDFIPRIGDYIDLRDFLSKPDYSMIGSNCKKAKIAFAGQSQVHIATIKKDSKGVYCELYMECNESDFICLRDVYEKITILATKN